MRNRIILVALGIVALTIFGFFFLRGPTPHIELAAEPMFDVGPITVTNTMFTSWLVVAFIVILVVTVTRRWTLVPSGAQNWVEGAIEAFYNLVTNVAGEHNGRRFFPVIATIFFFILISNWLSLLPVFNVFGPTHEVDHGIVAERTEIGPLNIVWVPFSNPGNLSGGGFIDDDDPVRAAAERADGKFVGEIFPLLRGPNTDLNTPLAIAIAAIIAVQTWGITSLGLFAYGRKFFNFNTLFRGIFGLKPGLVFQGIIEAFVGILELISEFVRLVSFTFRLFGNMFAGEVVILMFIFMMPLFFPIVFYGLELFVGAMQAFIFAMLTLVFAVMAVSHGEAHEAGERHPPEYGKEPIEEAIPQTVEPAH